MARRTVPWAAGAIAAAVLAVVLLAGGSGHRLRAVFTAALQVVPGQQVQVGGRVVGSISGVSLANGEALVSMHIDDAAWPLHSGTTAQLRFGGVAAYASRYVQLQPGPPSTPALADDALLPSSDTVTPVETDQIFSTFNAPTRAHLQLTISGLARTLHDHANDLATALRQGSTGLQQTDGLLSDLGARRGALSTLITAGASTFAALRATDAQLQGLVSNGATTFRAMADNAAALAATLRRLPPTLQATEPALAHLNRSLNGLTTLVDDIRPGAAGLASTAPPLQRALQTIDRVGPDVQDVLRSGTRRLPALTRLLATATPFLPTLSKALGTLAPMLACVRPYAPEIAGYLGTWQAGPYDNAGPYATIDLIQTPVALPGTTDTSARAVGQSGGTLKYAFPRPPGLNAGQPWLQPQCGAGPSALNPADDPEAGK
ncbi:MAG TPA: MlaD family protein [Solirubrobacteraceae bacterium]|nr:MlaD family protein [Solirubrobacteraceae bacterium]